MVIKKEILHTMEADCICITSDAFYDRIQIQKDLLTLFHFTLENKTSIDFKSYNKIVCSASSDMFLCVNI